MAQSSDFTTMSRLETVDPVKFGERLRLSRSSAGLNQEEVAEALGISRTTLVAVEQGQRRVRNDELIAFAKLCKVSVNELLRESAVQVDLVGKFRRAPSNRNLAKASEEALRLLGRLASSTAELETHLGQVRPSNYLAERPILSGSLEEQAEDLALELRHRLGLGLSPITDIVSLVEIELGVRIFFRPLHSAIAGVFAFDAAVGPCMLINSLHPQERQIQTIAHETGHFFCLRQVSTVMVDDGREQSREEKFVTLFAIAFLVPAAAIRPRFKEMVLASGGSFAPRHLLLLAHTFGVSFEAVTRRLEALDLLPQGTFDSMKDRGFSVEAGRRALGLKQQPGTSLVPPRLCMLAAAAFRRGLLSEGQLSEMLALERVQLREQLDALGGDEMDDAITLKI